jgi:hypothetical protein
MRNSASSVSQRSPQTQSNHPDVQERLINRGASAVIGRNPTTSTRSPAATRTHSGGRSRGCNSVTLVLIGRSRERETLGGVLDAVRAGRSATIVLRGEPGVGKTALLDDLLARADGVRMLRATAVQSEMELAFAGLHQVCAPLLTHLDRLPEAQRRPLEIAFGLSTGSAPDRFVIGLGVLGLLAEAAEEQPLLLVVDDAQWLDRG